jgi:hypothetical protein
MPLRAQKQARNRLVNGDHWRERWEQERFVVAGLMWIALDKSPR